MRTLLFAGDLHLSQVLEHDNREYPLDDPNFFVPQDERDFDGYIIVADTIRIGNNIQTNGKDLTLVAQRIDGGNIEINGTPHEFAEEAPIEQKGLKASKGGLIRLICKELKLHNEFTIITNGGKGQDGGKGKDMTGLIIT